MPGFRLQNFTGQIPKLDRQLIPDGAAQRSENADYSSGRIEALYAPKAVSSARSTSVSSIYRMFLGDSELWLSWEEDVDVAESPVFVENNFRILFSSDEFEPRQTDFTLAGTSSPYPTTFYTLGVPAPITAPTVSGVTGGSGTNTTRVYVYTFVTAWGEESAPSPASAEFTGLPDGTWAMSLPDVAVPNAYNVTAATYALGRLRLTVDSTFGARSGDQVTLSDMTDTDLNANWRINEVDAANDYIYITTPTPSATTFGGSAAATRVSPHNTTDLTKRVYRSVTAGNTTDYFLVGTDIPAATTTFDDDVLTDVNEPLPSLGWVMPPAEMRGIVVHPSGCLVGFYENRIYISEPYSPYAFPRAYELTLDFAIVGLAVFGQSVFVGTEGKPYIVTFSDPASAVPRKMDENWPCLSKNGIVTFGGGVYFPTNVGLAFVGTSGASLVTKDLYAQKDWEKLMPETFDAAHYNGRYMASRTLANGNKSIVIISAEENVTEYNYAPTAIFTDRENGQVYIAGDGNILQLNDQTADLLPYSWTSKEIRIPDPLNLGAVKLDFTTELSDETASTVNDANEAVLAANALLLPNSLGGEVNAEAVNVREVNYDSLAPLVAIGEVYYVSFTLWGDGELIYSREVLNENMFRLPAGKKYGTVEIRLSGTAPVQSIVFGDTPYSLKQV